MSGSGLYLIGALFVAIVGIALLVWALFADRSRRRKRCPKCWYDMSAAVSLRCPECGHEAKNERTFLKTRRRWKVVMASVLVFALAGFLAIQPKVQQDGWWSVMPTTAMLLYFQFVQDDEVIEAIDERISRPDLSLYFSHPAYMVDESALRDWQWRWFARRLIGLLADDSLPASHSNQYLTWVVQMRELELLVDLHDSLNESITLQFTHTSAHVRSRAIRLWSADLIRPDRSTSLLMPLINDPDPQVQRSAAMTLHRFVVRSLHEDAVRKILEMLEYASPDVLVYAASALTAYADFAGPVPNAAEALAGALERTKGIDHDCRYWLVRALAAQLEPDVRESILREAIGSDDPQLRVGGLAAWQDHELDPEPWLEFLLIELERDSSSAFDTRLAALVWLERWKDPELLRKHEATLWKLVGHEDPYTQEIAADALKRIAATEE